MTRKEEVSSPFNPVPTKKKAEVGGLESSSPQALRQQGADGHRQVRRAESVPGSCWHVCSFTQHALFSLQPLPSSPPSPSPNPSCCCSLYGMANMQPKATSEKSHWGNTQKGIFQVPVKGSRNEIFLNVSGGEGVPYTWVNKVSYKLVPESAACTTISKESRVAILRSHLTWMNASQLLYGSVFS